MWIRPLCAQPGGVALQLSFSGLNNPDYITNARDGSNRLFIIEQPGIISVVRPGTSSRTTFLDISARVLFGGEQGLLGLAFHPQFASNGRFFVDYTRRPDGATVIAEYHVSDSNVNVADSSENVLLLIPQPYVNHNGGMLEFGPDGYLYIGMGDGGSANDPENRAQNTFELLGKILRIDVDRPTPPPTNPYANGRSGRPEIYAIGLRNPFRFSFDPATGQLYVGDVGQDQREEVDIVTVGGNYGWRVWEGTRCTSLGPAPCSTAGYIFPIAEYDHSTNGRCSIIGGYVYRGSRQTFPYGSYVYGDYCSGELFLLQGGVQSVVTRTNLNITSFGEDESGELYVVGQGGTISRIVDPSATDTVTRTFNISAHGAVSFDDAGQPNLTRGYTRIQTANRANGAELPSGMAIVSSRQQGVVVSETSFAASPLISAGRIYAEVGQTSTTAIAIANPNNQPVTINFFFTDQDGSDIGQGSTTIDANHQIATSLTESPFKAPSNFVGTFTFSSSLLVSAIALHAFTNERGEFIGSGIPVAAPSRSGADSATIAQYADGGGWKTRVILINPADVTISGQMTLYAPNGQPLPSSLNDTVNSVFTYSIPARSSRELRSAGVLSSVQSGSISIVPDTLSSAPLAFALLQRVSNGVTVSETADFSITAGELNAFVESEGNVAAGSPSAMQSATAVTNPSPAASSFHFELYNAGGSLLGRSPDTDIAGHSQIAVFLREIPGLPPIPTSFQGVLRIVGGGAGRQVSAATFRARYNERGDFLMTPTPAIPEVFTPDTTELLFPSLVIGSGFETQLVLFSDIGSVGTIYFFDQNGNPLALPLR
jgi:glucose/arabinose dehydrogenase